jgi:phosphate/sulfate permease
MKSLGAILGGSIGGLIGAVIWAVVTHYSGWEIGWIAWGIGGLVGAGVRLGTGGSGGISHGGTAAIIALAAVLGGKWAAVRIELSAFLAGDDAPTSAIADIVVAEREEAGIPVPMPPVDAESLREWYPRDVWNEAVRRWEAMDPAWQETVRALPHLANPQVWLVWLADEVVAEFESDGRDLDWPPGMDVESAWREVHYPADVWAEARTQWDAMSEQDREAFKASVTRQLEEGMAFGEQETLNWWFLQSFTIFDLLWVGLAVVTAFKMGAGMQIVPETLSDAVERPPAP